MLRRHGDTHQVGRSGNVDRDWRHAKTTLNTAGRRMMRRTHPSNEKTITSGQKAPNERTSKDEKADNIEQHEPMNEKGSGNVIDDTDDTRPTKAAITKPGSTSTLSGGAMDSLTVRNTIEGSPGKNVLRRAFEKVSCGARVLRNVSAMIAEREALRLGIEYLTVFISDRS